MTDLEKQLEQLVERVVRKVLAEKPANDATPELVTVAAYASRLSVSERTVRDAIRDGRLEHVRIGRAVRIPAAAKISPRVEAATARARLALLGRR